MIKINIGKLHSLIIWFIGGMFGVTCQYVVISVVSLLIPSA